ncbi:MAG TPA: SDR family NAD(P)-dependent oxidoreductase [Mariprofundaceae bacterium]|nr:SDR family NAD(P)-dependent oxidoreductase [Mariprofundaceae bacterium]
MNVLITGANRGLGLGFVRHYLDQGSHVWACYRSGPDGLAELAGERLHLLRWDVGSDEPPQGELPASLDLLINNAGIYGPHDGGQSLNVVTPVAMQEVFNIDCVGPLRVVQRLQGALAAARGVIANISSKMGSNADNGSGGAYAYRAAKAALVAVSKSMAIDLATQGVRVITLHPGWVRTDMGGQQALIDVETSVTGMAGVISRASEYEPGAFVAFDGRIVPF